MLCLQCDCSMTAGCTECLNNSNPCHCVSEIEKLGINIHIDVPKTHLQRAHASPIMCLRHACSMHMAQMEYALPAVCLQYTCSEQMMLKEF